MNNTIQNLAKEAKARLRNLSLNKSNMAVDGNGTMVKSYNKVINFNVKENFTSNSYSEEFYSKVRCILNDDSITNPIGQLIESASFSKLTQSEKERYILKLSRDYLKCKERFNGERFNTIIS